MGWRDTQRKHRVRINQSVAARLRKAWAEATPQERIDFLAELEARASTPRVAEVFAGEAARERAAVGAWEPEPGHDPEQPDWPTPTVPEPEPDWDDPEIPAYVAAVREHGGDPLARALLTPTQLVQVVPAGRPTQRDQEHALRLIGADVPGGEL